MAVLPDSLQSLGESLALPGAEELERLFRHDLLIPWLQRRLLEALAEQAPAVAPSTQELESLAQRLGLGDVDRLDSWRRSQGLDLAVLEALATFPARLQAATEAIWLADVPGRFLERRSSFDQATLSVLRFADADLAQELYFQLLEGELQFAEVLERYGQDPTQPPRCLVGPMPLEKLHPLLARVAERYAPGALIPPLQLNDRVHLIRVERLEKASLDEGMQQRLLADFRQQWLHDQLQAVQRRLFAVSPIPTQP